MRYAYRDSVSSSRSLPESSKNKETTSETNSGLLSSCNCWSWVNCWSKTSCHHHPPLPTVRFHTEPHTYTSQWKEKERKKRETESFPPPLNGPPHLGPPKLDIAGFPHHNPNRSKWCNVKWIGHLRQQSFSQIQQFFLQSLYVHHGPFRARRSYIFFFFCRPLLLLLRHHCSSLVSLAGTSSASGSTGLTLRPRQGGGGGGGRRGYAGLLQSHGHGLVFSLLSHNNNPGVQGSNQPSTDLNSAGASTSL